MITPVEIFLAFAIDVLVGDPRSFPHPVVYIGKAIEQGEGILRKRFDDSTAGKVLVSLVVGCAFLAALVVTVVLSSVTGPLALFALAAYVWLASTTIALRGLVDAVREVFAATSLDDARKQLAMIVGRDTGELDEEGVSRAAIETLAENASDGIIAPLFYLAIGGLPLAMAYKAVNTLDSMVGYKNEKYIEFGRASAKLDDLFNYIPARLTGVLIVAAAYVLSGFSRTEAIRTWEIMKRDGAKHTSPNAGVPEAAMAGAIEVKLGGPSNYGGEIVEKPYIGDGPRSCTEQGMRGVGVVVVVSMLGLAVAMGIAYIGGAL
ncbi:adenosylcobinamide-phosphate synthase CbiB [Nitrospirota bacterium]